MFECIVHLDFLGIYLKNTVVPVAADGEIFLSFADYRAAPVILAIEFDHVVVLLQHPSVGSHVGLYSTSAAVDDLLVGYESDFPLFPFFGIITVEDNEGVLWAFFSGAFCCVGNATDGTEALPSTSSR